MRNFQLESVVIEKEIIEKRLDELARSIEKDYEDSELVMIGILKGAFILLADISRRIKLPALIDFMSVSSYGDETTTSGVVRIEKDLDTDIKGKDVLLVEDIVDSGLTIDYLLRTLRTREPSSLRIVALLDKPSSRKVDVKVDYKGFDIGPDFVVGYGLDCAGLYRTLPDIYSIRIEDDC